MVRAPPPQARPRPCSSSITPTPSFSTKSRSPTATPAPSMARGDADPLIVAGGPVATHCEPVADFIDAVLIGDGEEATTEIALSWAEGKRLGLPRRERLIRLAKLPGVYVPSLYETALDPIDG